MNKITLLLAFSLLFSIHLIGQKLKAELVFKDGKRLVGLGEPAHKDLIRFRKEKKAKKQFFSFAEVDTIKVYHDFVPTVFVFQRIKGRTYPEVLEVANIGKKVVFYRDDTKGFTSGTNPVGLSLPWKGTKLTHSFVRKIDENEALHLGSNDWMSKNFKKLASNYFSDCPSLVEKLQNREFKKRDIIAILDFYNNSCE